MGRPAALPLSASGSFLGTWLLAAGLGCGGCDTAWVLPSRSAVSSADAAARAPCPAAAGSTRLALPYPQQRRANHIRVAGQRVAPALQRQGLAAGLLQQLLQRPALRGISLLELLPQPGPVAGDHLLTAAITADLEGIAQHGRATHNHPPLSTRARQGIAGQRLAPCSAGLGDADLHGCSGEPAAPTAAAQRRRPWDGRPPGPCNRMPTSGVEPARTSERFPVGHPLRLLVWAVCASAPPQAPPGAIRRIEIQWTRRAARAEEHGPAGWYPVPGADERSSCWGSPPGVGADVLKDERRSPGLPADAGPA